MGTFNGNPLTMAAAKVNLFEVLTREAYGELERVNAIFADCQRAIDEYHLPASHEAARREGLDRLAVRPRSTSTATSGRSTTACRSWRGSGS